MLRSLVSSLVVLVACTSAPHENAPDVGNLPCVTCHQADYPYPTTDPSHPNNTDCAQCHDTTSWGDAGHPEAKFPITTGKHTGIACKTCHSIPNAPYTGGANTNCIQCHSQSQYQSIDDHNAPYDTSMPHFCLTCHPSGGRATGGG